MLTRDKLIAALSKTDAESCDAVHTGVFSPWDDVIDGIYGSYSSESDDLMIQALEAVRDRTTGDLMDKHGFAVEFMLYVLAGHGLTEYGTSPRYPWPDPKLADLWQPLIDKWKTYEKTMWED